MFEIAWHISKDLHVYQLRATLMKLNNDIRLERI